MWLVRIKKANPPYQKDGVYLFDDANVEKVPSSYGEKYNYDELPVFSGQPNLLLIRSGGIGDLMAYSVLHDIANVVFVTNGQYRPFLKLWKTPPTFKEPKNPIWFARNESDMRAKMATYGRLSGVEDAIELGSTRNWYEIINESAGRPNDRLRPQLNKPDVPFIEGCLVVSKASVVDRTANTQDVVDAVSPYFSNVVIAHEQDWTAQEYINALAGFEYVVSVDTSAIHIREGFGLPALGLYGAFLKECRTSGHEYTTAIQINNCTPCHRHSRYPCKFNTHNHFAPCLSGEVMIEQIRTALNEIPIKLNET
jgi:hypothetical protein